jgi:hypothetical protein
MLSETLCKELFYVVLFGVVLTTASFVCFELIFDRIENQLPTHQQFRDHLKNAKPSAFLANIKCIIHDFVSTSPIPRDKVEEPQ